MKILYPLILLLSWQVSMLQAQKIPTAPNKKDANGRQGKWVILYDKDWTMVQDTTKVKFYRVIRYKDDLPKGDVRDYYRSGGVQWKGKLLKDRPKDVMDGKCVWYYESGKIQELRYYDKGNLINIKKVGNNETFDQGLKYYNAAIYHKAIPIFEKHIPLIEKSFSNKPEVLYAFYSRLHTCYEKTGQRTSAQCCFLKEL